MYALMAREQFIRDVIKPALEKQRKMLRRNRNGDKINADASAQPDTIDESTERRNFEIEVTIKAMEASSLQQVEDALGRIDNGKYGQCHTCERSIPLERLKAIPVTECCVRCQQRREQTRSTINGVLTDSHRTMDGDSKSDDTETPTFKTIGTTWQARR